MGVILGERKKMEIKQKLIEFRRYIILGALILSAGYIWELVPAELDILGTYTTWVYLSLIALSMYLYYDGFWYVDSMGPPVMKRTVVERKLSAAPEFRRGLEEQRGYVPQKHEQQQPPPEFITDDNPTPQPSRRIQEEFKRGR